MITSLSVALQLVNGVVQNLNSGSWSPEPAPISLLSELESKCLSLVPGQLLMLVCLSPVCLICKNTGWDYIVLKVSLALICCQFKIVQFP